MISLLSFKPYLWYSFTTLNTCRSVLQLHWRGRLLLGGPPYVEHAWVLIFSSLLEYVKVYLLIFVCTNVVMKLGLFTYSVFGNATEAFPPDNYSANSSIPINIARLAIVLMVISGAPYLTIYISLLNNFDIGQVCMLPTPPSTGDVSFHVPTSGAYVETPPTNHTHIMHTHGARGCGRHCWICRRSRFGVKLRRRRFCCWLRYLFFTTLTYVMPNVFCSFYIAATCISKTRAWEILPHSQVALFYNLSIWGILCVCYNRCYHFGCGAKVTDNNFLYLVNKT